MGGRNTGYYLLNSLLYLRNKSLKCSSLRFKTALSLFSDMAARQSSVVLVALLLCLPSSTHSFRPLFQTNSITHREITQRAILRKTAEVCQTLAADEGRDFSLTVRYMDNKLLCKPESRAGQYVQNQYHGFKPLILLMNDCDRGL